MVSVLLGLQGYRVTGLQGKEEHGQQVQCNQHDGSAQEQSEPAGFVSVHGFGVQIDVGQCVTVHGASPFKVTGYGEAIVTRWVLGVNTPMTKR